MLNASTVTPLNIPHYLSGYTLPQIKDWAKTNGLKIPSGLKKAELVQYLTAAYEEKRNGVAKEGKNAIASLDILQPRYSDNDLDWLFIFLIGI